VDIVKVTDATSAAVEISVTVVAAVQVSLNPPGLTSNSIPPIQLMMPVHSTVTSATVNAMTVPSQQQPDGTIYVNVPTMGDGTYTLQVNVSGFGGSTATATGTYTQDTKPPATPSLTSPSSNATLPGPTVTVAGATDPNARVEIDDSNGTPVGSGNADGSGNFSARARRAATSARPVSTPPA
jgi:hypothetical protein